MEENRFFKFVWRFNGLIISIVGVLAAGVLSFAAYKMIQDVTRHRTTHSIVNVESNSEKQDGWKLGQIVSIDGAGHVMVALHSEQSFSRAYFSKISLSIRNYLFINTETSESRWLFNHNDYLIERSDRLRRSNSDSNQAIIAILYQLVKIDSDQDSLLTKEDQITLAITNPDGLGYREILNDVDSVIGYMLVNENTLFLLYKKDGSFYSATFSLEKNEVSHQKRIPNVGNLK